MRVKKTFNTIYSVLVGIAFFGGFVVFLHFLIGLMVGGEEGAAVMAIGANDITPWLFRASSVGVISGLVYLYLADDHELTLKKKSGPEKK